MEGGCSPGGCGHLHVEYPGRTVRTNVCTPVVCRGSECGCVVWAVVVAHYYNVYKHTALLRLRKQL